MWPYDHLSSPRRPMLRAPLSSEFDPSEEGEGSIDPLGLAPVYERLANRLLPSVTIRMGRPRFVTAMAVGACICDRWEADDVAADGETPPWLVYEWLVVEAFVRAGELLQDTAGIPGIQKVRRAITRHRPINAHSYLKTPAAFGFTGVFRRLATGVGVLTDDGQLDDGGYELIAAWAKDQGLGGIVEGSSGEGPAWREKIRKAVTQGMQTSQTPDRPGEFWRDLASRFDPAKPGRAEAKVLLSRILTRAGPQQLVGFVTDAMVERGGVESRKAEAPFLRLLTRGAPADLHQLLTAIDAYEAFARSISNAFDALRHCASINGGSPVDAGTFSADRAAKASFAALAPSLQRIRAHPVLWEWERDSPGFERAMGLFEDVGTCTDLFDAVLRHHKQVQENKRKRPWFDDVRGNRVVVRSGYSLHEPPATREDYVHEYRLPTFSRFLSDLGALR